MPTKERQKKREAKFIIIIVCWEEEGHNDDGAGGRRKGGSGTEVASLVCAPGRGRVRHLFIRAQSTRTHRIVFALVLLPMRFRMVSSGNEVPDV